MKYSEERTAEPREGLEKDPGCPGTRTKRVVQRLFGQADTVLRLLVGESNASDMQHPATVAQFENMFRTGVVHHL
jgi:hypothetical protein